MLLHELTAPVTKLTKVGPATAADYAKLGIETFSDLLLFAPRAYEDRTQFTTLNHIGSEGGPIFTQILVTGHTYFGPRERGKRILKILTKEYSGRNLSLICFGRAFLESQLAVGSSWFLTGNAQNFRGEWQVSSFSVYRTEEEAGYGKIIPVYPLTGGLSEKKIREHVSAILSAGKYLSFDDDMPSYLYDKYDLMHTDEAIRSLHFPKTIKDAERAKTTLKFSELLYLELFLQRDTEAPVAHKKTQVSPLEKALIEALPFSLTKDQVTVLSEIRSDMDYSVAMARLLQGDVGSGKTLVAWISALHEISKGGQVAFMAPTELLARQHADKAAELLAPLGVHIAFVTGEVKGKDRKLLLKALSEGAIDIAIGTHALFSSDVEFQNLRYVIIDEQHRFGVEQRSQLTQKGRRPPHLLLMSATPIPRTLAQTFFGDLSVSTIRTMPVGRVPIITYTVKEENRAKIYESIKAEFNRGHQAYFVYPRIDDEGESDLRDVNSMFLFLKDTYPGVPSALIHSKLPEEEKVEILTRFREGKLSYLVSTSVVEVGIDIPNATCMVIEHAERFGLAALHQLRGRVGRSTLQSWCFLVFSGKLTEEGKARMRVMKESNDGFYIAEQDLLIRGPGDLTGSKQSGFFRLRFASITADIDLVKTAHSEALSILTEDKGLIGADNWMLRVCLAQKEKERAFSL